MDEEDESEEVVENGEEGDCAIVGYSFCIPIQPTANLLLRCDAGLITGELLFTWRSTAFLECLSTWQSWAVVVE